MLLEIRERYRVQFPNISEDDELLRDTEIDFHLRVNTQGDDLELTAMDYFNKRMTLERKDAITKSILNAGYSLMDAYTDWIEEIFDVLILVDHKKKI